MCWALQNWFASNFWGGVVFQPKNLESIWCLKCGIFDSHQNSLRRCGTLALVCQKHTVTVSSLSQDSPSCLFGPKLIRIIASCMWRVHLQRFPCAQLLPAICQTTLGISQTCCHTCNDSNITSMLRCNEFSHCFTPQCRVHGLVTERTPVDPDVLLEISG